jgi:hypothetical protein
VSDPLLLALVIDDPLAPRVLAYWKALKLTHDQRDAATPKIATMTQAPSLDAVKLTLDRCVCAGLLEDGGISETAERWLRAHVGNKLGVKQAKQPTPKAAK